MRKFICLLLVETTRTQRKVGRRNSFRQTVWYRSTFSSLFRRVCHRMRLGQVGGRGRTQSDWRGVDQGHRRSSRTIGTLSRLSGNAAARKIRARMFACSREGTRCRVLVLVFERGYQGGLREKFHPPLAGGT